MKPEGTQEFNVPADLAPASFEDACFNLDVPITILTLHVSRDQLWAADGLASTFNNLLLRVNVVHEPTNEPHEWWLEYNGNTIWSNRR